MNTITNRHGDEIGVGQLWTDDHRRTAQRTLRIDAVDTTHATCTVVSSHDTSTGETTTPGRVVRIKVDSLHTTPAGNGYRLIETTNGGSAGDIVTGDIVVTFARVGRNHHLPALHIPFAEVALIEADDLDARWPGDRTNWQVVCERIFDYVRPHLRSSDVEVHVTGDKTRLHGFINVGLFRNGGSFIITHPAQEAQ